MKNAIIAGASGLVGRFLLNDLLSRDRYERVIALVRSDLGLSSPKLSTARVDFAAIELDRAGRRVCRRRPLLHAWNDNQEGGLPGRVSTR